MESICIKRWGTHIEAARLQGISLSKYAKAHGLCARTLMRAERLMKTDTLSDKNDAKVLSSLTDVAESPFAAVQVALPGTVLRAVLPNGVSLHCEGGNAAAWPELITLLAGLACSR
jgi:hypothetical protein